MSESQSRTLTPAEWRAADTVLTRFESAWREDQSADLDEYLPEECDPARNYLLRELIKLDLDYRAVRGESVRVEAYLERFPELDGCDAVSELAVAEIEARCANGDVPSAEEIETRFPEWSEKLTDHIDTIPSPTSDDRPPQDRISHYEIRNEVGRGGFAVVYRAWDPKLRRDVAIKLAHREMAAINESRERMLREARSAARLQHPAIGSVYEVGDQNGRVFIVSEFIDGPTLEEQLRMSAPTPDQTAAWTARCADALAYAHQCGIIHRDVKPANVLLRDNEPVLTDFGLAHQTDSDATLTLHGDILGTPAYMSPEQARGEATNTDTRTDVYSLGVVLYRMLCGRLPFEGATSNVIHRVIHEDPPRPHSIRPDAARDLETICRKAMAKEPGARYQTAAAMAEDLRRYMQREPILARPVGWPARIALWCRRRPALAATIAMSVALILAVAGFAMNAIARRRTCTGLCSAIRSHKCGPATPAGGTKRWTTWHGPANSMSRDATPSRCAIWLSRS